MMRQMTQFEFSPDDEEEAEAKALFKEVDERILTEKTQGVFDWVKKQQRLKQKEQNKAEGKTDGSESEKDSDYDSELERLEEEIRMRSAVQIKSGAPQRPKSATRAIAD